VDDVLASSAASTAATTTTTSATGRAAIDTRGIRTARATACAARARTNAHRHAGVQVIARRVSVLRFAVDDVRMIDVDAGIEAVAATDAVPIHVGDTTAAALRARPAPAVVVLEARVDVIRTLIVRRDDVRESRCHRRDEVPRATLRVAHI